MFSYPSHKNYFWSSKKEAWNSTIYPLLTVRSYQKVTVTIIPDVLNALKIIWPRIVPERPDRTRSSVFYVVVTILQIIRVVPFIKTCKKRHFLAWDNAFHKKIDPVIKIPIPIPISIPMPMQFAPSEILQIRNSPISQKLIKMKDSPNFKKWLKRW